MEKLNGFVTWEEECNNEIIRLNEWLKKLETYEEFAKFEEEMEVSEYGLKLVSKRGRWWIFSINHVYDKGSWKRKTYPQPRKNKDRNSYLFSDGATTGECHVKIYTNTLKSATDGDSRMN